MNPANYSASAGSVIIGIAVGDPSPPLTIGPEDLLTLLQVTLTAIVQSDRSVEWAREICAEFAESLTVDL